MSRVKYTANNYCHKPIKGGDRVEALIDAAAEGRLYEYLEHGNSINVVADGGMSALHALARKGSGSRRDRAALEALLGAGIDVNLVNFRNESALFRAVATGGEWLVSPLLEAGARLDLVNTSGISLLDLGRDNKAIQDFLERQSSRSAVPTAPGKLRRYP